MNRKSKQSRAEAFAKAATGLVYVFVMGFPFFAMALMASLLKASHQA